MFFNLFQNENGGCSHICLIVHSEHRLKCACPQGLLLSADEKNCIEPSECGPNEFRCSSGKCIKDTWRCNGTPDCPDDSDELDCPKCDHNHFTCMSNVNEMLCLDNRKICDGIKHCYDGYDEMCCGKDEFRCNSRNCLSGYQLCDGKQDCTDGEDEDPKNCIKMLHPFPAKPTPTKSLTNLFLYMFVGMVIIFVSLFLILCRCKNHSPEKGTGVTDILMSERNIQIGIATNNRSPYKNKHKTMNKLGACNTLTTSTTLSVLDTTDNVHMAAACIDPSVNCPSSVNAESLIDRNITGASSASSSAHITYHPRETCNPPPSPVTSTISSSLFVPRGSKNLVLNSKSNKFPSNRRPKKTRWNKSLNRGPPPTPCGTDIYEELGTCDFKYFYMNDNVRSETDQGRQPYINHDQNNFR